MTPDQALAALRTSPETFLRSHPVMIAGLSTPGAADFVIYKEIPTESKFKIATQGMNGGASLKVYNVPMHPSTRFVGLANAAGGNKVAIPGVMIAGEHQRDIMVTGQLTGCSFLVQKVGASVLCAHIQPQGGMDGAKLHTTLMNVAVFQGQPTTSSPIVFGRNFYPTGRATIIGVRRMGQWEIYAQIGDAHSVSNVVRVL